MSTPRAPPPEKFEASGDLTAETLEDDHGFVSDEELHISDEELEVEKELNIDDDLIIEEIPGLGDGDYFKEVHDQLPSVEEYKISSNFTEHISPKRRLSKIALAIAGLSLCIVSVAFIFAKVKSSKHQSQKFQARTMEVEEFLFKNKITTLPALRDIRTPQHKAAAFVADGDVLQMPLTDGIRFVERYILALMYYHFDGSNWTYRLNFLSGMDHCDWNEDFETAAGNHVRQGVICDEDGFVKELNLAWNNLSANSIPREIGYLQSMETLHMYYNEIAGYFSESFRHMPKLKSIGLMKNRLFGTIPDWIGEMTQLTTLGLGDNRLDGELPLGFDNLTNLRILGLDGNQRLTGSIDSIKKLRKLESLFLENNSFTGNLHNLDMPNLVELDVSNNALDEWLPKELLNHPTLRVLDINNNMMMGQIPDDIFENEQLEYFAAHNSGLMGTIPDRVGFLANLKHFDVSFNALTGTIPDTVTELTNLRYFATSGNAFDPQMLLDFSNLTNLQDLSMKSNNLSGKIPDWIGGLTKLQLLDLDANALSGAIPSSIARLSSLNHLLLNRNRLTGTIPLQLRTLENLQVLLLDGNSIRGTANELCSSSVFKPSFFTSDCYPKQDGSRPEIECRCCTQCCADGDFECNNKDWTSNIDPVWEYGFIRSQYDFNLQNAPAAYSKNPDTALSEGF